MRDRVLRQTSEHTCEMVVGVDAVPRTPLVPLPPAHQPRTHEIVALHSPTPIKYSFRYDEKNKYWNTI